MPRRDVADRPVHGERDGGVAAREGIRALGRERVGKERPLALETELEADGEDLGADSGQEQQLQLGVSRFGASTIAATRVTAASTGTFPSRVTFSKNVVQPSVACSWSQAANRVSRCVSPSERSSTVSPKIGAERENDDSAEELEAQDVDESATQAGIEPCPHLVCAQSSSRPCGRPSGGSAAA